MFSATRRLAATFLLTLTCFCLQAEDPFFSSLSVRDGLPSNIISAVTQDEHNFIWIGTGNGISRFDGYRFKNFKKGEDLNSLPANEISSLLSDGDYIWVGTWKGLCKINTVSFEVTRIDLGENNVIRTLYKGRNNDIWIGTATGLIRYTRKSDKFIVLNAQKNGLSHNTIRSVFEDGVGNLWVGTYDKLNKLGPGADRFVSYDLKGNYRPSLKNNLICDIKPFSSGTDSLLWVGTETGLCLFNPRTGGFRHYTEQNTSFSNEVIKCIYNGDDGKLWLGTDFGLNVFDPNTGQNVVYFHNPRLSYSIANNVIWQIVEDNSGVNWFVTSNGLSKLNKFRNFYTYHEVSQQIEDQSIGNQVKSILITRKGIRWLATLHGVIRIDPATNKKRVFDSNSPVRERILLNNVFALEEDDYGHIWIGTAGGINVWDEESQRMTSITSNASNGLTSNYIAKFTRGTDGSLWVSAWEGGLFRIAGNFQNLNSIRFEFVGDFGSEKNVSGSNAIWAIQNNELFRIDLQVFKTMRINSFSNASRKRDINCLYYSSKGSFWAGTLNGLIEYRPQSDTAILYPIITGNDINLASIIEDEKGNIWGTTNNSLLKFAIDDHHVEFFPLDNDIPLKSFFYGCAARNQEGELLFGGDNGYITLSPTVKPNAYRPKVYITSLTINNETVSTNQELDGHVILKEDVSFTRELVLNYAERSIAFEFAALHYWQPAMNVYAYQLEGYDKDWNYVSGLRNFAVYSNLSPNTYTFKVKGTNNYGIWSDSIAVMEIRVKPPLFLSKGFIALYVLLFFLLLLVGLRAYFVRIHLNNELKIIRLEKEHAEEIAQTKQQFFANISHELRTPISLILPPIQQILKRGNIDPENRQLIALAEKNSHRLLRVVNQILDFRKLEGESLKLKVTSFDLVRFSRELCSLFNDKAARNEITFTFHTSVEECKVWADLEKVETAFYNLLSNAFKFTPTGGSIDASVSLAARSDVYQKGAIVLKITDSGIGIPQDEQAKIFERFYQTNEATKMQAGSGIGLTLAAEYAKLHSGIISVESVPGVRTCFSVILPLGNSHFPVDSIHENEEVFLLATKSTYVHADAPKEYTFNLESDKPLVLIVENNMEMIDFIRISLKNKYNFIIAENGAEGLTKANSFFPEIIVSDIMMPVLDGLAFCKKVKEHPKTSHIPIILLTAKSQTFQKIEGIKMGADIYLTKPFEIELLEAHIDHLLIRQKELADYFHNELLIQPSVPAASENRDDKFMKKAIGIIEANISNPDFSVEVLSEEMGMSSTHLYRKLVSLTHLSANEIIKKYRIKKASLLLKNKEGNISEIMYAVGFSNLSYFSKCFRAEFGLTPKEYQHKTDKTTVDIEQDLKAKEKG